MDKNRQANEVRLKANALNQIYEERIVDVGINRFLKEARSGIKKNAIPIIKDSFEFLKKDMKLAPNVGMNDKGTKMLINTIQKNKNDLPIFEIEDDDLKYDIKFPTIPFTKFYISTNICERIGEDIYNINGFFILDYDKDFLLVIYKWDRHPSDGWAFNSFLSRKRGLLKDYDKQKVDVGSSINFGRTKEELHKKIQILGTEKFDNLMKKLIYKINRKEYTTYKKHSYGNYSEKSIVFAHDIRSHKRHFWKDSGKFKIPLMSKEEWESKGYETDELVLKDGILRKDVPFKIIAEFKAGELKKVKPKVYDLIEKRVFRQEEKLFKILRELFPNEFIKRHDRKTLKGLEMDFWIRKLNLAFEYDGEQHFDRELCENVFKSDFEALQKRDKKKDHLCRQKHITLIRIKYDEPLNKTYVKKKIKNINSNLLSK